MPKTPEAEPDEAAEVLTDLANIVLADHFFDPDRENEYKALLSRGKRAGLLRPVVLEDYAMDLDSGEVFVQLHALKTWTQFRLGFSGEGFEASVEGTWSFDHQELRPGAAVKYEGDADDIMDAAEELIEELEGPDPDDEEMEDMLAALADEDDAPLIGDDPAEPPPATSLERNRVKAIAKRVAKMREANLGVEDRAWLEQTPQTLPVITEAYVAAAQAKGKQRDDALIDALELMLSVQLECVRYRQDRGWEWAGDMLDDYQQRVAELGEAEAMPREDWFRMAAVLAEARVPVPEAMQHRLAQAGFEGDAPVQPEEMIAELRGFLDELSTLAATPFDVMETMANSAAVMPPPMRGFLATELSLSPHAQLRDTVPLMLLDKDSGVRRDAALALEQAAGPDTLSGDSLRRVIAVRNWIPAPDRPALDSAVRKARLGGVAIAPWPAPGEDIEFYATVLDGSGAQSVLAVSRTGRKGLFGGLLLRHGDGVVDAWTQEGVSRAKVTRMLKEAFTSAVFTRVEKPFVDLIVQHAIATGAETGVLPPPRLLLAAERLGGTEWQDRAIDVAAEAERLFDALDDAQRSAAGVLALQEAALAWMQDESIAGSWYEDGPEVRDALTGIAVTDIGSLLLAVLDRVLPPRRGEWTERFLLMALWCAASQDAEQRARSACLTVVARALTGDRPLDEIPVMRLVAMQTVRQAAEGGW